MKIKINRASSNLITPGKPPSFIIYLFIYLFIFCEGRKELSNQSHFASIVAQRLSEWYSSATQPIFSTNEIANQNQS